MSNQQSGRRRSRRSGGFADERTRYRERTWAPPWFWVLIWGACLLGAGLAIRDLHVESASGVVLGVDDSTTLALVFVSGFLVLFPTFLTVASSCLDVEVRDDHLFVAFGPVHVIRKRIPYATVEAVEAVTYRPIAEFGGWGLRFRRGRTAWTIRGNQAARITLSSGRRIYVGSRSPQRLVERVRRQL